MIETTENERLSSAERRPSNENPTKLLKKLSQERFREWYQERQYRENIENGQPYFNKSGGVSSPNRHSPSQLLQCHRKTVYSQLNAPEEQKDPKGIFWIGSRFEEDVALPFLREAITGTDQYVTNSLWVDFTVQTDSGDLHIKGETDPVIVDADCEPLVLTEIKTKDSIDETGTPSSHHRAQAHAYMYGLSEKYDRDITDAVILYGGRTSLDIQPFHITFDPFFWRKTVIKWAAQHTSYRLRDELPPADPEQDWECNFCSYRERCGNGDLDYSDVGPAGLLPGVAAYPKSKVVEYLEAHDEVKLTPTLAKKYPEVAAQYPVSVWVCTACGSEFEWDSPEWDEYPSTPPLCPECLTNEIPVPLRPNWPYEQDLLPDGDQDG